MKIDKGAARDPGALEEQIARDIHSGRLSPGTWLKQIDMEHRYGFERPAVRTALDGLTRRKLVENIPNRGYRVVEFTEAQVREIFFVRSVIESAAMKLIVETVPAPVIDATARKLEQRARFFEAAMAESTFEEQIVAARLFHAELWDICPNQELVQLIRELRDRVPASLLHAWYSRPRMEKSVEQKYRMARALLARDVEQLQAVTAEHILGNLPELTDKSKVSDRLTVLAN